MTDTKQSPEPTALEIAIKAKASTVLDGIAGPGRATSEDDRRVILEFVSEDAANAFLLSERYAPTVEIDAMPTASTEPVESKSDVQRALMIAEYRPRHLAGVKGAYQRGYMDGMAKGGAIPLPSQSRRAAMTNEALKLAALLVDAAEISDMGRPADPKDYRRRAAEELRRLAALAQLDRGESAARLKWYDGQPPFPQNQEWFIAKTIYGDRVVLTALPKEHTYDYKTADDTYMLAKNVKRWMQFPDCEYIPPTTHLAPVAVAPQVPAGWKIEREPTGELVINGPSIGVVVRENPTELRLMPEEALYMLAMDLLAASPQPTKGGA